jgi:dienelactone hydrolase
MRLPLLGALAAFLIASAPDVRAQQFFYPPSANAHIAVARDIEYARSSSGPQVMDVYYSADQRSRGSRAPAFVFFAAGPTPQLREPWPAGWGRAAAANGIVGLVPDIRPDHAADDLDALVGYIGSHAGELGIDANAVVVCAGSGNVATAFPLVEAPRRTGISAAVMLYGAADIDSFRLDLPVLLVRAGQDRPDVNRAIAQLALRAVTENAPVTLINHAAGHHAFETLDDNAATVAAIDAVFAFVKSATAGAVRAASRDTLREVEAAGAFMSGDYARASAAYAELLKARPRDPRLGLSYGESLLAERRYADACAQFDRLKGVSLGPRDVGIPAAQACALKGDATAAIAWLRTIPKRFLPPDAQHDAAFASLRDREDFRALFRP